jgi:hypothetical protein
VLNVSLRILLPVPRTRHNGPPRRRGLNLLLARILDNPLRFNQRGDTIVANRLLDFPIRKDFQISRSNTSAHWFNHSDLKTLAVVLLSAEQEYRKHHGPLTRRFILTMDKVEKDDAGVYFLIKSCKLRIHRDGTNAI